MRPSQLNPLFAPIGTLPGIGPKLAPLYERLVGDKVVDLLWHLPTAVVDRRYSAPDRAASGLTMGNGLRSAP